MQSRRRKRGNKKDRVALGPAATSHPDVDVPSVKNAADSDFPEAGSNPPIRSMNMNTYGPQQASRQTPRLQNTQKPGLGGNNAGGWAFGPPSSGGFGGLGAAPGLGQARPGQLSGFAQVMGGGSGQGPIDMSDFPSLGGQQPRAQQSTSGWNSSAIRQQQQAQAQAALPQASAPQPQQQRAPSATPLDQYDGQSAPQPPADHSGSGEEFPPLSGQPGGEPVRSANGYAGTIESPDQSSPQPSGPSAQLPIREAASSGTNQQAPIGSNHASSASPAQSVSQQSHQTQSGHGSYPGVSKPWAEMTEQEKYGMMGLQKRFETIEAYKTGRPGDPTLPPEVKNPWICVGHDMSGIDVELEQPGHSLHKTFHPFPDLGQLNASPFNSRARQPVPTFELPPAYSVNNVPDSTVRMPAFGDETLLVIFYESPHSANQDLAAMELTARGWRYHKVLREWLRQEGREGNSSGNPPLVDLAQDYPPGTPAVPDPMTRIEKGIYIFFNPPKWQRERRFHFLNYDELCDRHVWSGTEFVSPFPPVGGQPMPNAMATGMGASRMASSQMGGADPQGSSRLQSELQSLLQSQQQSQQRDFDRERASRQSQTAVPPTASGSGPTRSAYSQPYSASAGPSGTQPSSNRAAPVNTTDVTESDWLPGLGTVRPSSRNITMNHPVVPPGFGNPAHGRMNLAGGGGFYFVKNVWDSSINKDTPLPEEYKGKGKGKAKEKK
ncbi:General negative regulator of transcription subunit 2 [Lecanosticta acicola]|uniref:General negative regulator of transcription subunit 2 n=1 Tax=Lecanosticta acicola TaxID=111012 RepID=A0AAI8Z767_9PEZI|nr:General negative regulator of transcription subunit 2 [Lecanosticta acicola]